MASLKTRMTMTRIRRYIGLLLLVSTLCQAGEERGCAVPTTTVYQPVGSNKYIKQAIPTHSYRLIKETKKHYIILSGSGSKATIGQIPKRDKLGNPTANIRSGHIQIRPLVNVGIYEGTVPLEANKRYPVVSETPLAYRVLFKYRDYATTVDLARANCVYIPADELRREREDEIAKRKKREEKKLALRKAKEKARRDAAEKARAAREANEKARREAEWKAQRAREAQEERLRQQLVKEQQYAQLAIVDARAAQNYQDARAIITKALANISITEVAQGLIQELDSIRLEIDRKVRGEKALRIGMRQLPETINSILKDQSRGDSGEKYWSRRAAAKKLYAPTTWEIVSTDMQGPDAIVRVRVDSSNAAGVPIRKIWTFTMTFEDRWRVFRIADE